MSDKIEIFAPNLSSIDVVHGYMPSISLFKDLIDSLKAPIKPTKFQFCLKEKRFDKFDTSWFIKLKEILHIQNQTQSIDLCINNVNLHVKDSFTREGADNRCHLPSYALVDLSLRLYSVICDYICSIYGWYIMVLSSSNPIHYTRQ